MNALRRAWAITAKDAAQELRRRVALAAVFFFAATALALVSYAIGPFGLRPEDRAPVQAALFWRACVLEMRHDAHCRARAQHNRLKP